MSQCCGSFYERSNSSTNKACACARQAKNAALSASNSLAQFNAKYLGAFPSNPAPPPFQIGALYWNTSSNEMYVWTGASWIVSEGFDEFSNFIATGTTTARNLVTRFGEVFNIKDFGATGDGTTDDGPAIQAALNASNAAGGGVVYIPPGRYRRADTIGSQWTIYSNTSLVGDGDQSVIFFDDRPTTIRSGNDLIIANTPVGTQKENIEFKNFKVEGTLLTYLNDTNGKLGFGGDNIDGFRMESVTIVGMRYFATAFNRLRNAVFTGNTLQYISRDGIRFTHSWNVTCSNNTFKSVCDDAIAAHSYNNLLPVPSGLVITNNVLEASQGIKVLGAKQVVISGNKISRALRSAIHINTPATGNPTNEGDTNQFDINITNNVISDTFESGDNYVIYVNFGAGASTGRYKAALAQQPGVSTPPYPYNYLNDIYNGNQVRVGMFGINISGNIITRTLPDVAQYSDLGYTDPYNPLGQKFDRVTPGFFSNPAITEASFTTHGIIVTSPINGLNITNNIIQGTNYTGILLDNTKNTNILDFANCNISGNTIIDVKGIGLYITGSGSGFGASQISIINNTFDIDPYFRNANHNANNTWATTTSAYGITASGLSGLFVSGNVFKNCSTTGLEGPTVIYPAGRNFIYADFTSGGVNDTGINKGVRFIPAFKNNIVVPINGDPTSATYGQTLNTIVTTSFTIPSSGYYITGTFVDNANPAVLGLAGSQYTLAGWWRATTGNAHVLNTDWLEVRTPTGT
jgi:hypothetical protein